MGINRTKQDAEKIIADIPNDNAFPIKYTVDYINNDEVKMKIDAYRSGLSKRELYAVMVVQGLCANQDRYKVSSYEVIAAIAVKQADALIEELNK